MLFSEIKDRYKRLNAIADFVEDEKQTGEPIDIILLQEVVGGPLSGTINSSLDLKRILAKRGILYNLYYVQANGIPGVFTVGNTILSRCKISFKKAKVLPFVLEKPFERLWVLFKRKVIMCRIDIPSFGEIDVYDVHLCSFCNSEARLMQIQVLLGFIDDLSGDTFPVILGGDFNLDINFDDEIPLYELITE